MSPPWIFKAYIFPALKPFIWLAGFWLVFFHCTSYYFDHPYSFKDLTNEEVKQTAQTEFGIQTSEIRNVIFSEETRLASFQDSSTNQGMLIEVVSWTWIIDRLLNAKSSRKYERKDFSTIENREFTRNCFQNLNPNNWDSNTAQNIFWENQDQLVFIETGKWSHSMLFDPQLNRIALCHLQYWAGSRWNE